MSNFINDGAGALPDVKSDARPATGAVTEIKAEDLNDLRSAALDLRTEALDARTRDTDEATARAAADAAIIASGTTPADVGVAPVIATGSVTARTVADRFADYINAKDYGCVGDGATDDTLAMQAAVDAAMLSPTKPLYVPAGVYKLNSTINVTAGTAWEKFTLIGAGSVQVAQMASLLAAKKAGTIFDCQSNTNSPVFNFTSNNDIAISHCSFRGPVAPAAGSTAIYTAFATIQLTDVRVLNFEMGANLRYVFGPSSIVDCHFTVCTYAGIQILGCQGIEIRSSVFANSGPAGTTGAGGNIVLDGNATDTPRDILIDTVLIDEGGGACVDLRWANRVTVRNCRIFTSSGGYGIRMSSNTSNCKFDNIYMESFSRDRIPVNTMTVAGTGHKLYDIYTNPNGGGDILDTTTDSIWVNVNGRWKVPPWPGNMVVSGTVGANEPLASLIAHLDRIGLIVNSTDNRGATDGARACDIVAFAKA